MMTCFDGAREKVAWSENTEVLLKINFTVLHTHVMTVILNYKYMFFWKSVDITWTLWMLSRGLNSSRFEAARCNLLICGRQCRRTPSSSSRYISEYVCCSKLLWSLKYGKKGILERRKRYCGVWYSIMWLWEKLFVFIMKCSDNWEDLILAGIRRI